MRYGASGAKRQQQHVEDWHLLCAPLSFHGLRKELGFGAAFEVFFGKMAHYIKPLLISALQNGIRLRQDMNG